VDLGEKGRVIAGRWGRGRGNWGLGKKRKWLRIELGSRVASKITRKREGCVNISHETNAQLEGDTRVPETRGDGEKVRREMRRRVCGTKRKPPLWEREQEQEPWEELRRDRVEFAVSSRSR